MSSQLDPGLLCLLSFAHLKIYAQARFSPRKGVFLGSILSCNPLAIRPSKALTSLHTTNYPYRTLSIRDRNEDSACHIQAITASPAPQCFIYRQRSTLQLSKHIKVPSISEHFIDGKRSPACCIYPPELSLAAFSRDVTISLHLARLSKWHRDSS